MRTPLRFAAALVGLVGGVAMAAEPPKPNALTEKEIEDGWISLFDGETTFGWKSIGDLTVRDGNLVVGGTGSESTATLNVLLPAPFDAVVRWRAVSGGMVRYQVPIPNGTSGFGMSVPLEWTETTITTIDDRGTIKFTHDSLPPNGRRYTGKASVSGTTGPVTITLDSQTVGRVEISSIKFRPLGLTPLFNGKDLTGWKVFDADPAKAKAKFEVTPAGELHVTGGPGDIQTEKKYGDFVLQVRAKTNGPLVNSGVFFRCVPGEFQRGYEAQIQNAYLFDRTKPLDAGTGAIYRRVSARKVVSTDGEWFTMTVIANGPRISTWVNGYQTVDWTDDRQPNDNPRLGLRTAHGHISIQGHAPPTTADVLFKSIQIADLTKN